MAFSATSVHPIAKNTPNTPVDNYTLPSLLGMLILTAYAAKKGSKSFNKTKRQLAWSLMKYKAKSLFSKKAQSVSDRTILYILLGVLFLVLLAISPISALVVAVAALILYLAGVIRF